MKKWIRRSYIQPHSVTYQFLTFLNNHLIVCLICLTIFILAYPIIHSLYYQFKRENQQKDLAVMTQQHRQQTKLLHSLQQHQIAKNQQDHRFSQINQKINQILDKYQIKTDNLQWDLNTESILSITLNQNTKNIFKLLAEINQLTGLYAKEITLTKLHKHHQIQLNGIFILIPE